jgi:hypothetical protein
MRLKLDGFRHDVTLMHGGNAGKPLKIALIQRKNAGKAIGLHDGHEPRIMHLNAADAMGSQQSPPVCVDEVAIREKDHPVFNIFNAIVGFDERKTKTIAFNRTSADIPKLRDVLQAEVQVGPSAFKDLNRGIDWRMLRIARSINSK